MKTRANGFPFSRVLLLLVSLLVSLPLLAVGCRSIEVTNRDEYKGPKLPRPSQILVYDFAPTPQDLPAWSEERQEYADRTVEQSEKVLELGHQLGQQVANELVKEISAMGLPAVHGRGDVSSQARVGDIMFIGAFTTVNEGSATERVVIGFGKGAADLRTYVAGYKMTESGPAKLGSGETGSESSKAPGVIAPVVVTLATANPIGLLVGGAVKAGEELSGASTIEGTAKHTAEQISEELEIKFREQGWIE